MSQLPLFSPASETAVDSGRSCWPDAKSKRLLTMFRDLRLAQGARPQTARREVSQLRAMLREAGAGGEAASLRTLFADLGLVARVLREPVTPISLSTGCARLRAAQRFISLVGRKLSRDPDADLMTLDALLPARRPVGWHSTGTLVAGTPGRRRRRGPTLNASDLHRIVESAGSERPGHSARDRALVALHCFSGLRPDEIVQLQWRDLTTELTPHGRFGLTAVVVRRDRPIRLLLPGPASDAIQALACATGGKPESLSGPVFCAQGVAGNPLSYRAARDVLRDACERAGLPPVESTALRAACAHWLRGMGLSDHEVAAILGLARVHSVDRLLRHHAVLNAQQIVREVLDR